MKPYDVIEHLGHCPECGATKQEQRSVSEHTGEPVAWNDRKDEWTDEIAAHHPLKTKAYTQWATAMEMVGARHSKGALVELVCWLLQKSQQPKQEQGEPVAIKVWTDAQHERAYRNSPELHKDVQSLAAFKRVAKAVAAMYGIAPQQRKPLTDEQITDIVIEMNGNEPPALFWKDLTRAIEAAHGIKE